MKQGGNTGGWSRLVKLGNAKEGKGREKAGKTGGGVRKNLEKQG